MAEGQIHVWSVEASGIALLIASLYVVQLVSQGLNVLYRVLRAYTVGLCFLPLSCETHTRPLVHSSFTNAVVMGDIQAPADRMGRVAHAAVS